MTRRDFGTTRRLPSGRWQARFSAPDGSRLAAERTFATRAEAAPYLAGVQSDLDRGAYVDPTAGSETFGDYATTWLAQRADLRPRTAELYEGLLNRHLLPLLATVPLARLSPAVVRRWQAGRLQAGVGRSTVAKAYRLLRTVLNTAVADEVLGRNPCLLRGAGSERTPERVPPTLLEAHTLAEAIQPRWRMLVLLATWSGLRSGELVALRRGSVDLPHGRLTVTDQLVETAHGVQLGPPKTDAGRRTVHLPPHLLPELTEHLNHWVGPAPDAWLFCGPLGAPLVRRNLSVHRTRCRADVGLPGVRFHDLRHLSATLAATTGATTRELMARVGHSSPRAALIYQHAAADRDRAVAGAMSGLVPSDQATFKTTKIFGLFWLTRLPTTQLVSKRAVGKRVVRQREAHHEPPRRATIMSQASSTIASDRHRDSSVLGSSEALGGSCRHTRRDASAFGTSARGSWPQMVAWERSRMTVSVFSVRPMTGEDAHAIAVWRYPREFAFYN